MEIVQTTTIIKTPEVIKKEHAQSVARSLNDYGFPVTADDIEPPSADTQVKGDEIKDLGGIITGEDFMHSIGLGEEGQTIRFVDSSKANFLQRLRLELMRKTKRDVK